MAIINKLKKFILSIYYYFRDRKLRNINRKLKKAVEDQTKDRDIFLNKKFMPFIRTYYKQDDSGKYIPLTGKNKAEAYEAIMCKHGADLKRLNIHFSKNLQVRL